MHIEDIRIQRKFSSCEILLLKDLNISQWLKSFIIIRRLCVLDPNILIRVR
jgi:hypothetical protein